MRTINGGRLSQWKLTAPPFVCESQLQTPDCSFACCLHLLRAYFILKYRVQAYHFSSFVSDNNVNFRIAEATEETRIFSVYWSACCSVLKRSVINVRNKGKDTAEQISHFFFQERILNYFHSDLAPDKRDAWMLLRESRHFSTCLHNPL